MRRLGVDGAQAGVVMASDPLIGRTYRQEFRPGVAEDLGKVVELGASLSVPAGSFDDVLVTEDWNPLESSPVERQSYARGVGLIHERPAAGGRALELVSYLPGPT